MVADIYLQSAIYWFMALGLWIALRVVRYADLAVENTVVLAAMAACLLPALGLTGPAGLLLAVAVSFLAALAVAAIAWASWKLLRVPAVITSLALSYILYSSALGAFGSVADGTGLPKLRSDVYGLVALSAGILMVCLLLHRIRHSSLGRHMLAAGGNPALARTLGMKPAVCQWLGLSFATLLMVISGLLHACYYTYVNIGDATGLLLLGIFSAVLVANGLCPRVLGFWNGVATFAAVGVFQAVITAAIYAGIPIALTKGLMGLLLIAVVALLRFTRVPHPISIS